ncbi:alpha/beta fold hydrolase [Natronococcus roseus]|uniref:alpha/beta fold hydrolase n=1 Tax=Natronococcus roseus TaxID=1052014 RepID=UPI00374D69FB
METVRHHGRETAYEVADRGGTEPTICFVHGSGGSRAAWKAQHRLADRYPVVAVDLSGHGDSEDVDASAGYTALSAYADDVAAVLEATDASVLAGSSLGGAVTMQLLLERDPDIDGIVLAGTGAKLGVLQDLLEWLENDFDRALEFLHGSDRLFHDPDPELRDESIERMRECGQGTVRRDFRTCHRFDVRDDVHRIDVPALAVYGEHDQLTPPQYHEYLADEIGEGDLVEIEGAAHLAMLEQPVAFNEAVAAFVGGLEE